MPDSKAKALASPYHKDAFRYDEASDSDTCPEGKKLRFARSGLRNGKVIRRYLPESAAVCRSCPAFGVCTRNYRHGRYFQSRG
jgi:hypothetical protein